MGIVATHSAEQTRSVLELIGNTPMLRFKRITKDAGRWNCSRRRNGTTPAGASRIGRR